MGRKALYPLSYAVRLPVVGKYLGQLALLLAALTAMPLAVALSLGEDALAFRLGMVMALLIIGGVLPARLPPPARIQENEAFAVVGLAYLLGPLLMAYPLMASGIPFADALFEATSGLTTTGLSTLASVEDKTPGFFFIRAWFQWFGGLGIAVLSVALVMGHHVAARRLFQPEAEEATLVTTARTHARRVLAVYSLLTLVAFLALWPAQGEAFTALLHALAAVSTGGFSRFDQSLAGSPPAAAAAVTAASVAGAIALPLYFRAYLAGPAALFRDVEVRALLALGLGASILLLIWLPLPQALFLAFSAQTTAGFTNAPQALPPGVQGVLILAMFTGGASGSTAGGIKLLRLLVFFQFLRAALLRSGAPEHAVVHPILGGQPLEDRDGARALLVIVLFAATALLSWLPFVALGYDALDALFEVVSAMGTVGLSSGIAGPGLPTGLKLLLCADMLLGRLEVLALLVVCYPRTWFGKRRAT